MNDEEMKYIQYMQSAYENEQLKNLELNKNMANSVFGTNKDQNLIEFQLNVDDILERFDHLLRGHVLKFDNKGSYWKESEDKSNSIFTEAGAQELLRNLSMYLHRDIILSYYTSEEKINKIVYDFGNKLLDLIYRKYEDFFFVPDLIFCKKVFFKRIIDKYYTQEEINIFAMNENQEADFEIESIKHEILLNKIKHYEIIVLMMCDNVEATLLRALQGLERESLRKAFMVTQNTSNMPMASAPPILSDKKFSLLKPTTWF